MPIENGTFVFAIILYNASDTTIHSLSCFIDQLLRNMIDFSL